MALWTVGYHRRNRRWFASLSPAEFDRACFDLYQVEAPDGAEAEALIRPRRALQRSLTPVQKNLLGNLILCAMDNPDVVSITTSIEIEASELPAARRLAKKSLLVVEDPFQVRLTFDALNFTFLTRSIDHSQPACARPAVPA